MKNTYFNSLKERLNSCLANDDQESAHINADDILEEIALNTNLTAIERVSLVEIYQKVAKWYA